MDAIIWHSVAMCKSYDIQFNPLMSQTRDEQI